MMMDPSQMQGAPQGGGIPPGLLEALQGAGQAQDPAAGLPPELMQMLQGAGQADGASGAAQGSPPDQGQQPDFYTALQQAMDILRTASPPDAQDMHNVDKLVAGLSKVLATHEKEHQQAMGGNAGQMRAMTRAYGG